MTKKIKRDQLARARFHAVHNVYSAGLSSTSQIAKALGITQASASNYLKYKTYDEFKEANHKKHQERVARLAKTENKSQIPQVDDAVVERIVVPLGQSDRDTLESISEGLTALAEFIQSMRELVTIKLKK